MTWVFGYGSLIWRPGFTYISSYIAKLPSWERRLWQGSPDHRGTPLKPGRVVTLMHKPDSNCYGKIFEIAPQNESDVLNYLDERESGGYRRHKISCVLENNTSVEAVTYIATPDNPNFLGPSSADTMVSQIISAKGASGTNSEYVVKLDDTLKAHGIQDSHIEEIANDIRRQWSGKPT